jgi:hypothetical protein
MARLVAVRIAGQREIVLIGLVVVRAFLEVGLVNGIVDVDVGTGGDPAQGEGQNREGRKQLVWVWIFSTGPDAKNSGSLIVA